ncbi:MAG: DNA polymerase IV [Bdellovibrionota bacterium]
MSDRQRKIIHVDMDCFYAQVEIKDNPQLRGKPIAVGGSADRREVLTTASYEARAFGVRSAMATSKAMRLCPELILVPVHFDRYREESQLIRKVFARFTDKIQPLSLDEAYLDVSHHPSATKTALEIRKQIWQETSLTSSAGIAPNKFLAKVASDWKKPNGQFTIAPDQVADFVRMLKVEKIPGVGKVTAQKMHGLGVYTCADLQKWSILDLNAKFGSWGVRLFDICRGMDDREVSDRGERKSLSIEHTYPQDLESVQACAGQVAKLYKVLTDRLEKNNVTGQIQALVVKLKFFDFKQTTLERSDHKVPSIELYKKMITEAYHREKKPVRLIGLGVKFQSTKNKPRSLQINLPLPAKVDQI